MNTNKQADIATIQNTPAEHNVIPMQENTLVKEGKSAAITINTPFTVIPGLPGLSKILARIDKTTQQDLGFTFKASAIRTPDSRGENALQLNLDYIGVGWMSSKFNVQLSPFSIKIESNEFNHEPHWGCNASVLSSPMGLVHERAGIKGTFNDCNSTRTFSAAPEISYQNSKTFRPLSTVTGGYFFGNAATLHIPSEYVPTFERIKAASPSLEEWKTIAEHVIPSIPAIQIGKLIDQDIEIAGNFIKSLTSAAEPNTLQAKQDKHSPYSNFHINQQVTLKKIEPSSEEKTSYIVQKDDTLSQIGKKTGHPWPQIFAMNKTQLNNNPNRIYPGQELHIPENHSHSELLKHPVVQAQIAENLKKQQMISSTTER